MKTQHGTLKGLLPFAACLITLVGCGGGSGNGDTGRQSEYLVTDLGTLGGPQSRALSVNNSGQVVGFAQTSAGEWKPFLWQNGQMTALDANFHPDYPLSINDANQIVGSGLSLIPPTRAVPPRLTNAETVTRSVSPTNRNPRAAMWVNGQTTFLGTLGGDRSVAYHINNSAQIVGNASPTLSDSHAFLWQNGVMQDMNSLLPPDSGWELRIACINDAAGNVVGEGMLNNAEYVFFYDAATKSIVESLPGTMEGIHDINESGEGAVSMEDVACIGRGDQVIDLNTLISPNTGWQLTAALAINDQGQIVGEGIVHGQVRAFLLTPATRQADTRFRGETSLKSTWEGLRGWLPAYQARSRR